MSDIKVEIHKYKDKYVIFRYDESHTDWTRTRKSEYWNWWWWKNWFRYAKIFPSLDEVRKEFLLITYKNRDEEGDTESD